MFNKKADELGDSGAAMGFADGNGYGLEFDSFCNENQGEHQANHSKHIALSKDRLATNNKNDVIPAMSITTDLNVVTKINDNQWHDVEVKVRKNGVKVYLDGIQILNYEGYIDQTYHILCVIF